jgi:hypothetical protein
MRRWSSINAEIYPPRPMGTPILKRCFTWGNPKTALFAPRRGLLDREINLSSIDDRRLKLINSKRPDRLTAKYVMDEATNLENSSQLVRDWQNLSESSLAEVWLNEEEDIAWQDL